MANRSITKSEAIRDEIYKSVSKIFAKGYRADEFRRSIAKSIWFTWTWLLFNQVSVFDKHQTFDV